MPDIKLSRITAVALLMACLLTQAVSAQDMQAKGLEIAKAAKAYDKGFTDFTADMTMTLKNKSGDTSTRIIRIRTLEVEGDGDKSLSIFDEPADVKGTAMLTYSHGLEPDDQWLYLPALKRVKRINAKTRSGPFMGSEFAYEDLSSFEVEKYRYRHLGDELIDGVDCYVLESVPVDQYSGYSRRVSWIDKQDYKVLKVDFYDRREGLRKTLRVSGYQLYLDRYWRAEHFAMINHETGKSTDMFWSDYRFGTGLGDPDFDKSALKRAR